MQFSSLKSFGNTAPLRQQQKANVRSVSTAIKAQAQNRQLWFPGAEPPKWLDGNTAGDYGFDPLSLGADAERFNYFKEAELYNGRWAMAGVAGMIAPDLLRGVHWQDAGAVAGSGPFSYPTLIFIEFVTIGFFEYFRYKAYKEKGTMSGVFKYFPFDPLGLGGQPDIALKEIKNGRLAMIAFFGFLFQAYVTGKGPIDNLTDHIADPWHNNIYTSRIGNEFTAFAILFAILPTVFIAK